MIQQIKIPVWVAILININIVIGSAFFLGAGNILAVNGILAPVTWLLCGLMLLPLVIVLAQLAMKFPQAGGLYVYSQQCLGPWWGFISGWGYYIGTVAANTAVIHAFSTEIQKIEAPARFLNSTGLAGLRCDIFLVGLFTLFNLFNIELLEGIQVIFSILKSIPLILVMISLPFLFNPQHLAVTKVQWSSMLQTLPWVFFAFIGIEACCAIVDKIEDGKRNAPRVILISFGLILSIYTILQAALFCIYGSSSTNPFLSLLPQLTNNQIIVQWGNALVLFAILSSFLGGFYGMYYYNNWNLYAIGKEGNIIFGNYLTRINSNKAPWVCVLIQFVLVFIFLISTNQSFYLITMSDFGTTLAYFLSVASFFTLERSWTSMAALLSCSILAYIAAMNLIDAGFYHIIPFIIVLIGGFITYKLSNH